MSLPHTPIMVGPILEGLCVAEVPNGHWIDGTLGAGGHSHAILTTQEDSRLLGFDLDAQSLALAEAKLSPYADRAHLCHASYLTMREAASHWLHTDQPAVDGILLDLGISSMQVDSAERGFAFRLEGPLDMRFDPSSSGPTAKDLVNELPADELADLIFRYGEEHDSRRIARAIVAGRPIHTTTQLATLLAKASRTPAYKQKIHPATRTFQALRIAVNDELAAVEAVIPIALDLLKAGGRLAIITFHSLEDRIVKQAFKLAATDCICPPKQPICTCGHLASVRLITHKPLTADDGEVAANPRARSAKLRIVEKLP